MDRILRGTAATISIQLAIDDTDTAPSPNTATVEVLRDDGTVLLAAGTATTAGTNPGEFAVTLTPANTALLDVLTARWTANISTYVQTLDTQVEIVGGFVCPLQAIDVELDRGGTAASYDLDLKLAARNYAIEAFEQMAGVAFSPRYTSKTFDPPALGRDLMLPTPRAYLLRSVTSADVVFSQPEIDALDVTDEGGVYNPNPWPLTRRSIVIGWEYGYHFTPADVSRAVAIVAAHILKDGPFDDRGYAVTEEGGAVRLLTAGVAGASFSIPDVEAALKRHRVPTVA